MKATNNKNLVERLIAELTLDEKIAMIHGAGLFQTGAVERLNIPSLKMSDGPMGVRADFKNDSWVSVGTPIDEVSYCPSNSAIANTWNRKLAKKAGKVLGEEARARGKDIILAPGINIKRTPACGRNFEYFSEDPYLTAELAVPLIKGIEENDVAACVKHFALNQQEEERLWVNVEIDERTLREIYLPAFKAAVKRAKVSSLMGAYNLFRGEHCCESKGLLQDILRNEWGYEGVVISDWGAVHHTREAAESPLDIEMSVTPDFDNYCLANPLKDKLAGGEVFESTIDEKLRHIINLMLKLKMIDILDKDGELEVKANKDRKSGHYNTPAHRKALLEAARESIVLLKNKDNCLPLSPDFGRKILIIGQNAVIHHALGGGSAEIKALYEITPLLGIGMIAGGNTTVDYLPGYYIPEKDEKNDHNWQEDSLSSDDDSRTDGGRKAEEDSLYSDIQSSYREEALAKIKDYDDVIFVGGLTHDQDTEGRDRSTLELPYGQSGLIESLLDVRPDMVLVMMAGSPVAMGSWKDKAKAIVYMSYSGMEGGRALAEVLFGKVNPSGKLAESFPYRMEDTGITSREQYPGRPLNSGENIHANLTETYAEGVFVGYRHYEKHNVPVQFCFGHGLSYTEFSYRDISVEYPEDKSKGKYIVRLSVKNTGKTAGSEIVQLYIGETAVSIVNPIKELKAFEKLKLEPGESKELEFKLGKDAFAHYDTRHRAFVTAKGSYTIYIGSSSQDIRQTIDMEI